MKNKKPLFATLAGLSMILLVGFSFANKVYEPVKAENYYQYSYVLKKPVNYTYTYDADNGTFYDRAIVNGVVYDNVDSFRYYGAVGNLNLYVDDGTNNADWLVINNVESFIYQPKYVETISTTYFYRYERYDTTFDLGTSISVAKLFNPDYLDQNIYNSTNLPIFTASYYEAGDYVTLFEGAFYSQDTLYTKIVCHFKTCGDQVWYTPVGQQINDSPSYTSPNASDLWIDSIYFYNDTNQYVPAYFPKEWTSNYIRFYPYLDSFEPRQSTTPYLTIYASTSVNLGGTRYTYSKDQALQTMKTGFYTEDYDNELNNVFNIFTLLFSSLMPILSYHISASITLGTLLLVPVVLTLILCIFKLIKR